MRRITLDLVRTAVFSCLLAGCAAPRAPAALPERREAWIAVLSGEMTDAIEQVARHAWIVGSLPGERLLRRWELLGSAGRSETSERTYWLGITVGVEVDFGG